MKQRRHVRMFKPHFARLVEAGTKCMTIRPVPKREIRPGDVLDLRAWTGRPYRSKQRPLRVATCTAVTPIELCFVRHRLLIKTSGEQNRYLWPREIEALAERDGFASSADMADFFAKEHGLPFAGVMIEWAP